MSKLEDAEAALLALETPTHAAALALDALQRAKFSGDPTVIDAAQALSDAAEKAKDDFTAAIDAAAKKSGSGDYTRQVAMAAEAVLALRGEQHTETGVLPPNFGIRTVKATKAHAEALAELAQGSGSKNAVALAEAALVAAIAADKADKTEHMTAGHEAALADHEGAE